ncbi:hypothetical protein [Agriterribacter sp.]|uniref:hypothetical protein n=1 Tax=Agriterribacter sp. TaxID=2821509 RepID=UPI002CD04558|nr:hypothetical protein [Agriterribacter sp.]HTN05368.1 hypothetical protein [Agriterribacter sp.]
MDKILRELEDAKNTEASVVKKLVHLESKNRGLGDSCLETRLPGIFNLMDDALGATINLQTEYAVVRNQFVKDNKLDEINNRQ